VSLLAWGVAATQTVDTIVDIPDGTPLTGSLVASCENPFGPSDTGGFLLFGDAQQAVPVRSTVSQAVDILNAKRSNSLLSVQYVSGGASTPADGSGSSSASASGTSPAIETTLETSWVLSGTATSQVTQIDAMASPATYGDDVHVSGTITGPSAPVEVRVYLLSEFDASLVATAQAEVSDGQLIFDVPVSGLTGNADLLVAVDGGDGYTPAETLTSAAVLARVSLTATPRTVWRGGWVVFTASVAPRFATGTVRFQYYDTRHKKWRALISKRLTHTSSTARATCMWRPLRGAWKVRAVYGGSGSLGGGTSPAVTVKVR
jgi:hypothetical protein